MNSFVTKLLVGGLSTATLVVSGLTNTTLAEEERIIVIQDNLEEENKTKEPAMITITVEKEDVEGNFLSKTAALYEDDVCVYEEEFHDMEYADGGVSDNLTMEYTELEENRVYEMMENSNAVFDVPSGGSAKPWNITYMNYTAVTKKSSPQYKLLNSDMCYTDEESGIRMVNGMYCIAIGTGFHAPVGTVVGLVTEEDVIPCIVSDIKADQHTDATHTFCTIDGSVIEFVVDKEVFKGSEMYPEEFDHTVKEIAVYNQMI